MAVILPSVTHLNCRDAELRYLFRRNGFRGVIAWAFVSQNGRFLRPNYERDFWPSTYTIGSIAVWPYCRTYDEECVLIGLPCTTVVATQQELDARVRGGELPF